ncbi:MAG: S53 family peptidase [Terracidiphilus sp.]
MRSVLALVALGAAGFAVPALSAQVANRILQTVDTSQLRALPNHHPLWAVAANSIGPVPSDLSLNQLTLVLSRPPQQQAAFDQFVADQQNPTSPDYHHWLTPAEVGARFGLSDQDIATIAAWLQSQGLHVNWVSPSRIFIGFGGSAANVGHAFQTEMNYYSVRGEKRLSVNSDPLTPTAIAPAITAIRGLYTTNEQPNHHVSAEQSATPQLNGGNGAHFLTPSDFDTIYDVPASITGAGMTIGIISWSRTNFADFDNFKSKTGATFADPTEVVPTAYGGIDPGPAYTAPPTSNVSLGGQSEATLDVTRAGSVAPGANLLLVVSSQSGTEDGIGADAQYLVNTTPVPAQVMSISFGACEASAGSGGVAFWDNLFQTAAAEGISVFVSSGDSGASGCDTSFSAPPSLPTVDSPNYICSSSYATCVGGTEFADTASPSTYWSSTNGVGYLSALSYIPEGAWNESASSYVAATGGGASTVIATPAWQTGAGVPSPGTGRYTPDVSFSASDHDGYFACMAAASGSCVTTSGGFSFIAFSGTSAAAPSMAGVAALLGQLLGAPQGNLNPQLYSLATSVPLAFHDVTVASSGVSACSVDTASMCDNTIPAATGGSFRPGYLVGDGYDEATGLGSLDVATFIHNYPAAAPLPTATTGAASAITTTSATLAGAANPNGTDTKVWFLYGASSTLSGASQTPSQDIGSGTSAAPVSANISGLTAGTTYYFQLEAQSSAGINFGSIQAFTTSPGSKTTPTITWNTPAAVVVGTALSATQLNATASVPGTFLYNPPAGTVMSAIGNTTLSTTFTPTNTSAYNTATSSVTLAVAAVLPGFTLSGTAVTSLTAGATSGNTSTITVQPSNGFTGPVTLTAVITTGPSNAQDVPTLGFGATSPVSIANTSAGTATLTISTTASQNSCAVENEMPRGTPWYTRGGAVLACLLLFGIVPRRHRGRAMLGMLLLFVALAGGLLACGGGSKSTCNVFIPGTAAGSYTITVTGTSGSITATSAPIAFTVQ